MGQTISAASSRAGEQLGRLVLGRQQQRRRWRILRRRRRQAVAEAAGNSRSRYIFKPSRWMTTRSSSKVFFASAA
jgi:hypothetical protein